MRIRFPSKLLALLLVSMLVANITAAPPKEERTIVEAGVGSFYSPDGKWLAYKTELLQMGVISTAKNAKPTLDGSYSYGAFTGDSKTLIVWDANNSKVVCLDPANGKTLRSFAAPFQKDNDFAQSMAASNDGKKIAMTSFFGSPVIVDSAKGTKIADLEKCRAHRLVFSKDDATIFGYDGNGAICTWDASSGKQTNSWNVAQRDIVQCAFSSDGKLAAAAEADTGLVRLWDMGAGKELGQLKNGKSITSIAISPDGKTLAVGSSEPKAAAEVKLWDIGTQKELDGIKDLPARALSLGFSPDGKSLIVSTQGTSKSKAATRLFSLP